MKQGFTPAQFCVRYGIPLTSLNSWEMTTRKPTHAAALLITMIELFPTEVAKAARILRSMQ